MKKYFIHWCLHEFIHINPKRHLLKFHYFITLVLYIKHQTLLVSNDSFIHYFQFRILLYVLHKKKLNNIFCYLNSNYKK